jgi:lipoic acid synthetase
MIAISRDKRLPPWFRIGMSTNRRFFQVRNRVREGNLHTVCEGAACPNRNECWNAGTATFLILGDRCTRNCGFCNIAGGTIRPVDPREPQRVADAVKALDLDHAVVTSVTRDDLPDGGAGIFADTISAIRLCSPDCRVEVLVPDFQGSLASLAAVLNARPDILNHNIETVPSLYSRVRPGADYERSLLLLRRAKERGAATKTGLMLGLGEGIDEVRTVLRDLRSAGCGILTLGQYLRPSLNNLPVERYYRPEEFDELRQEAMALAFRDVISGPRVRSSYRAGLPSAHGQTPR